MAIGWHIEAGVNPYLDETMERRAGQPFVDAQRFDEAKEGSDPHLTAVGHDGIAENGDQQGTGAGVRPLPEPPDDRSAAVLQGTSKSPHGSVSGTTRSRGTIAW